MPDIQKILDNRMIMFGATVGAAVGGVVSIAAGFIITVQIVNLLGNS